MLDGQSLQGRLFQTDSAAECVHPEEGRKTGVPEEERRWRVRL